MDLWRKRMGCKAINVKFSKYSLKTISFTKPRLTWALTWWQTCNYLHNKSPRHAWKLHQSCDLPHIEYGFFFALTWSEFREKKNRNDVQSHNTWQIFFKLLFITYYHNWFFFFSREVCWETPWSNSHSYTFTPGSCPAAPPVQCSLFQERLECL